MGDSLTLDDGRTLSRSSMAIAGVLFLTAQEIDEAELPFKTWLNDVSDRPNGFASVDLRGLSKRHRELFHNSAQLAYKKLSEAVDDPDSGGVTFVAMSDLIAMLNSMLRGEPPQTEPTDYVCTRPARPEDISEIWND